MVGGTSVVSGVVRDDLAEPVVDRPSAASRSSGRTTPYHASDHGRDRRGCQRQRPPDAGRRDRGGLDQRGAAGGRLVLGFGGLDLEVELAFGAAEEAALGAAA